MTTVSVTSHSASQQAAACLVLLSQPADEAVELLAPSMPEELRAAVATQAFALGHTGERDSSLRLPSIEGIEAQSLLVVGVGKADDLSAHERARRGAGVATRALAGVESVVVCAPSEEDNLAGALAEGAVLGAYQFSAYRGASAKSKAPVAEVHLAGFTADVSDEVAAGVAVATRQCWARDLVNLSPSDLYPESFAQQVRDHAPAGVTVEVLEGDRLVEEKLHGHLAVGAGSNRPPRVVKISYAPAGASGHVVFVGKGITFDSGGLSIKPSNAMIAMKCDMGGAATVAAATLAIADVAVPVNVTTFLCLAENMCDAESYRLGDVITYRNGTTVEVHNTDAEGRLVLADGLCLASDLRPDAIVDMATLTGACVRALGTRTAGVMGNDDDLQDAWVEAAAEAGEPVWPLPIPEESKAAISSTVADLCNVGKSGGGALTAAAFLREFVGKDESDAQIPWIHVDIAGTAFHTESPFGHVGKGGTGYGVRTAVNLVRRHGQS